VDLVEEFGKPIGESDDDTGKKQQIVSRPCWAAAKRKADLRSRLRGRLPSVRVKASKRVTEARRAQSVFDQEVLGQLYLG